MTLQTSTLSFTFDHGIDTKSDSKLVDPPYLTQLQNGIFTSRGSIRKRYGTAQLSQTINGTDASITSGAGLATFNRELLLFSDSNLYSYSDINEQWLDKGTAVSFKTAKQRIISDENEQFNPDMCTKGSMAIFAWEDSRGGIRGSIIDLDTNVFYLSDVPISSTGTSPRTFCVGNYMHVLYADGANLKSRRIAATTAIAFDAETTLITNLNASGLFDATPYSDRGAIFAYSTTTNTIKVAYVTNNGLLGVGSNGYPDPIEVSEYAEDCITIMTAPIPAQNYIGYHNTTAGVRVFSRNSDLTPDISPRNIDSDTAPMRNITGAFSTPDSISWFYEITNATASKTQVHQSTLGITGTVGTPAPFKRSVGLASKAWTYFDKAYVVCAFDTALQATYFTFAHDGMLLGKNLGTLGGGLTFSSMLPRVREITPGIFLWAALEKGRLRSDSGAVFSLTGVSMLTLDYTANTRFINAQLGQNLHLVGGILQAYDGNQLVEHGFHVFPEDIVFTPSASGGSIAAGSYGYQVTYEWTDAQGQYHQSTPSADVVITTTGTTSSVQIEIPTLRITGKEGVLIAVYRTTMDDPSTLYRINGVASPTLNDPTVDSVTITDIFADSSITSNQILYTVGGILDNDPAPPCSVIVASKQRLFLIDDEDGSIWYSKPTLVGEGAAFSLAQQIPPMNVHPTALAILDDKVTVFEANRIFAFAGDGPNILGQQDSFTPIQLVNTDVGCDNQASIGRISNGIMFQSHKGIYLLDRSLSSTYIGAAVEAYNSQIVTSAVLIQSTNQIRFTTEASDCLVYDYLYDQWSIFTNHVANDAVSWNTVYAFVRSDGGVRIETPAVYTDNGASYPLLLEMAWIKLSGLQGYQRIRWIALLGQWFSSHTLVVDIGYNYDSSYIDTLNFVTDTAMPMTHYGDDPTYGDSPVYGGSSDLVYQWRSRIPRQKCEAIRFRFRDAGTSGESYSLSGFDLEVALKKGLIKLGPLKTI